MAAPRVKGAAGTLAAVRYPPLSCPRGTRTQHPQRADPTRTSRGNSEGLPHTLVGVASLSTFRKTAVTSGDPLTFSREERRPRRMSVRRAVHRGTDLSFGRPGPPDSLKSLGVRQQSRVCGMGVEGRTGLHLQGCGSCGHMAGAQAHGD